MITFATKPYTIGKTTVLRVPAGASAKLPSRGMVLVRGTIDNKPFVDALEPDGKGSHWLKVDAKAGDNVSVEMEPSKDWPEPNIPADLQKALDADPKFYALWMDTTPMARWDWIRWIRATNNPDTRANHIVVAYSKLRNGTKRPCCFNRSMCTDFTVAKNGVLLDPA